MDADPAGPHRFEPAAVAAVYRAIAERRDMRYLLLPDPVDEAVLGACFGLPIAPPALVSCSPGWFSRIRDRGLRRALHRLVEDERGYTAEALGERQDDFLRLKVEGILEAGWPPCPNWAPWTGVRSVHWSASARSTVIPASAGVAA